AFRLPDPKSGASASSATFAWAGHSVTRRMARPHRGDALPRPDPMLPSAASMTTAGRNHTDRSDLFHGLFLLLAGGDSHPRVARRDSSPASIPCPTTGRALRVATIDAGATAICPSCSSHGHGAFVSFVGDLRMA